MSLLSKEATQDMLSAVRHYGSMRFSMMAAFFILMGLLVNAYLNWKPFEQRDTAAWIGVTSAAWFAWFEFLLSYNLIKLWNDVIEHGCNSYKNVAPQRNRFLVWVARVTLPLPYLVAGGAWGSALTRCSAMPWLPAGVALALWAVCIAGWIAAEKRKW